MAKHWLLKTEPSVFAFADFAKERNKTTPWEGVRNYQARNLIRDAMKLGDRVFIYHSSTDEPAIMGIAEIVKAAYPDPAALDPKSPYYDEKPSQEPRWFRIDVKAVEVLERPVTLAEMRKIPELKSMVLLQKGSRLSVQPVEPAAWKVITKLGKPKPF